MFCLFFFLLNSKHLFPIFWKGFCAAYTFHVLLQKFSFVYSDTQQLKGFKIYCLCYNKKQKNKVS